MNEISRMCEKPETRSQEKAETQYPKRFSLRKARVRQLSDQLAATAGQEFGNLKSKVATSIWQRANNGRFAHMSLMDFPPHHRPNVSRLETFRTEIAAMRASNWPFLKIADWLKENHQVTVSKEAVRQFCRVRGIVNISVPLQLLSNYPIPTSPEKQPIKFEYDESKPIHTRRNDF